MDSQRILKKQELVEILKFKNLCLEKQLPEIKRICEFISIDNEYKISDIVNFIVEDLVFFKFQVN